LLATENAQVKVWWAGESLGNQLSESLELLHPAFAGLGAKQLRRSFDVANRVEEVELPDGLGRLQRVGGGARGQVALTALAGELACGKEVAMPVVAVTGPLRDVLGDQAAEGLAQLLSSVEVAARENALVMAEERFARRLAETEGRLHEHASQLQAKTEGRFSELNERVGQVEFTLHQRINEVNQRITEEVGKLDKRITEEVAKLENRIDQVEARLDKRITEEVAELEKRIDQVEATLDKRITEEVAKLENRIDQVEARLDKRVTAEVAGLKADMSAFKAEIINWMFLFWLGQLVALAGLIQLLR
jgi:uncharacterized protein YdcH (DUF465 family)